MSDSVVSPPSDDSATPSRRGQSLVEFALVLPMLITLLLGIADFGRVFHAGIVTEAAARNAAEAVAQEYLQIRRGPTLPTDADYARLHGAAKTSVCEEAERLPNRVGTGSSCSMPFAAVCIHDEVSELPGYEAANWCGKEAASAPPECDGMTTPWTPNKPDDRLPYVEVRVCYRFTTLFNLSDLRLPLASGLSLGEIWLQKDRAFTVADY
jgi:hypothetical protein